jgi:hypothetical protein
MHDPWMLKRRLSTRGREIAACRYERRRMWTAKRSPQLAGRSQKVEDKMQYLLRST